MEKEIKSSDFTYPLPDDRIAKHPLAQRDQSKLLFYKGGKIEHRQFFELPDVLPPNSSLFFNDTKVIPARLLFRKETGAQIEVFLLQPADDNQPVQLAMQQAENTQWHCTIGNLKRWKEGATIQLRKNDIELNAKLTDAKAGLVDFSWIPAQLSFAEIVNLFGNTPLPPYLHRDADAEDKHRYQTVYSHYEGAVAAPTAGLHFTQEVLEKIKAKGILTDFLTLHVSAGTFQPIKTENALDHAMHSEQIIVSKANLNSLLIPNRKIIAVGTTSMRTLESIYWYGVKLLTQGAQPFIIAQNDPYVERSGHLPSREAAILAVLDEMDNEQILVGHTSIYMVPGYRFNVCDGLITNFHQPGSTLMLLVAAFTGSDWHQIYQSALDNEYRFLSYGDSSLLLPRNQM
ncbi:MAG TPA: S-adenosylmethionine tRNA ribosyltransferase [Cytophagales bacterium]|nr:S-adenosylmethionine tRNA ribosyltransferase [Cytophagales bacterium]HCR53112.1 S-adenosylmethionine tRNA ribosyltransferase [Cytophagales bacterium]